MACTRLVVREGAAVTYNEVLNNGEIRVSTGGASLFFGAAAGAGSFACTVLPKAIGVRAIVQCRQRRGL